MSLSKKINHYWERAGITVRVKRGLVALTVAVILFSLAGLGLLLQKKEDSLKSLQLQCEQIITKEKEKASLLKDKQLKLEAIAQAREEQVAKEFVASETFIKSGLTTKTKVEVKRKEQPLSVFIDDSFSNPRIIRKTTTDLYVGLLSEGRGTIGYETFHTAYRINLTDGSATKLRTQKTILPGSKDRLYINDISPNGQKLAYVVGRRIIVEDLLRGEIQDEFEMNSKFPHLGGGIFSSDSSKLAYGATSSYQSDSGEEAKVLMVDLATHENQELARSNGGFYNLISWEGDQVQDLEFELLAL